MKSYLVATITCPDKPGVVEHITELVLKHSANWEDSRMARLGGDFAVIVLISVAQESAEGLTQALRNMSDNETTVAVKVTQDDPSTPPAASRLFELSLTGADHEGIVHTVSAYLAGEAINVEAMDTHVSPAPMSGSPLFHMNARIKVAAETDLAALTKNLHNIGDDLGVDIALNPLKE